MGEIASQITSLATVYSTVYSDADQRKHQNSAALAFVRGIHRGPVNSPHRWPVTRKMFLVNDVIMFLIIQSTPWILWITFIFDKHLSNTNMLSSRNPILWLILERKHNNKKWNWGNLFSTPHPWLLLHVQWLQMAEIRTPLPGTMLQYSLLCRDWQRLVENMIWLLSHEK